ncbi:Gfo/Idh/MocA family oxidoreductase [Streptomyces sp. NPDC050560]|uniref:Gfo/Idh/MocA family oxidoreductase n=1 Tax=Streptomyces sp. NPDC050560 TaxID=3365630 RepID=UPI0037AB3E14
MLQPLVVGLGRSGAGLHLRTLRTLAARTGATGTPPVALPAVGHDPRAAALALDAPDLVVVPELEDSLAHLDPARTVVHLCVPPGRRLPVLEQLAALGFRRVLVEKPLAATGDELDALVRLRERTPLRLVVVAHWLTSRLAGRLRDTVRSGRLGALRRITVDQHKPRFARSLTDRGHRTALDVEIPHSLGLVLDLAGPARLRAAHCWDLRYEDRTLPLMGGASVELAHDGGVLTRLRSDLGAPVRQRRVHCVFDHGTATAHFPVAEDDHHAQLALMAGSPPGPVHVPGRAADFGPLDRPHPASHGPAGTTGVHTSRHVLYDDALTDFLEHAYRAFRTGTEAAAAPCDFASAHRAARLLCEARDHCVTAPGPAPAPAHD